MTQPSTPPHHPMDALHHHARRLSGAHDALHAEARHHAHKHYTEASTQTDAADPAASTTDPASGPEIGGTL